MKLFEYQSMIMLGDYGIPVPAGEVAIEPAEAARITERLGGRAVVKAQVLIGGRGKQGGVKLVGSPCEAGQTAGGILAMKISGMPVRSVRVAAAVDIIKEFYVGLVVNRNARKIELIFSAAGGVDIEEVAASAPDKILRVEADPFDGFDQTELRRVLAPFFERPALLESATVIIANMYRLFRDKDCSLLEINPLALTVDGTLSALDAKIVIDDNGLIKHPELESLRNGEEYGDDEIDAKNAGLSFVGLNGNIGCMVNGAGLAMATMDMIKHFGGEPANFLDVGGSSNPQKVVEAIRILLRNGNIRSVLLNIFGGITRCDDIARGVIMARDSIGIPVPLIIRLIGTNDALGRAILSRENYSVYEDLSAAVRMAVKAAAGEG